MSADSPDSVTDAPTQPSPSGRLPDPEVEALVHNTVAVMTVAPDRRADWRREVARVRDEAAGRGDGWRAEVELFTAVLGLLDNTPAELVGEHPYAPALAAMRDGIAAGGPPDLPYAREIVEAVRAFVGTDSWDEARRVVEAQHAILLRPEVDGLFERNIGVAMANGDERGAGILTLHRDVLRLCRTDGVEAAFKRLREILSGTGAGADALRGMASLPADFIVRTVEALRAPQADKLVYFSYLKGLADFDHDLRPLATELQAALFDGALDTHGHNLTGAHAHLWRQIVVGMDIAAHRLSD